MHQKNAKILSLVPSWTETLIVAGVKPVGRTRFCIHPFEAVKNLPVVGGTKNLRMDQILKLNPDYVIVDKEENTLEMAEELQKNKIKLVVSHVTSLSTAADFLNELSVLLENESLKEMAEEYKKYSAVNFRQENFLKFCLLQKNTEPDLKNLDYIIWKNPFMAVGQNTFIGDVFGRVGLTLNQASVSNEKYPKVEEAELKKSYCLFSSEPYPFEKEFEKLSASGFKGALIDGEKISWYGIRNLNFLRSCLK